MQFATTAFGTLIATVVAFWLLSWPLIEGARHIVQWFTRFAGLAYSVVDMGKEGWKAATGYVVVGGAQSELGSLADVSVGRDMLIYLLRSFPIFAALMLAPPYNRELIGRISIGLLMLFLLLSVSAFTILNCNIAILVNHMSPFGHVPPPSYRVSAQQYPMLAFQLSMLAYYLCVMILPLLAPILLWLWLKPAALQYLMSGNVEHAEATSPAS